MSGRTKMMSDLIETELLGAFWPAREILSVQLLAPKELNMADINTQSCLHLCSESCAVKAMCKAIGERGA